MAIGLLSLFRLPSIPQKVLYGSGLSGGVEQRGLVEIVVLEPHHPQAAAASSMM